MGGPSADPLSRSSFRRRSPSPSLVRKAPSHYPITVLIIPLPDHDDDRPVPDVYYSIHRVPANTNGDSYQSTYTVQVRRAYSSLRYSRHRPIRFDSDRVDVIRGDVKRDRQRARDQHEWAPWRYTDGPRHARSKALSKQLAWRGAA